MNLPQFLKRIDASMADMSRAELEAFVHELARTLPESWRADFLKTMQTANAENESRSDVLAGNAAE